MRWFSRAGGRFAFRLACRNFVCVCVYVWHHIHHACGPGVRIHRASPPLALGITSIVHVVLGFASIMHTSPLALGITSITYVVLVFASIMHHLPAGAVHHIRQHTP